MDCPSCGRGNDPDRVECSQCEALLVDVFDGPYEKTEAIRAIGEDFEEHTTDSGDGFTRTPAGPQHTGDLPRLFRFGNRYQVLEKLGEGGMGRVYKALDLELDRAVALKTIRAEKGKGPEILKRFKQELVLARKITHKNVVRIYDLGEAEGVKFFTMELIEGQSLRDILRARKKLPPKEAVSLLKQMLSGLAEAHSQGVIHRDLKPHNIMIDGEGLVRIMDFGIARTADTATLTKSDEMMGTPDYISPEQVKGETATAQSDLYSTGVILYELLTGQVPFKGDTPIAKVVARLQTTPAAARTLNPEIPTYLERIVLKLMELDSDLRYKTAAEVLQDLEREQVDSSRLLRTRKAILRRRGWVAACLAASLGVGAWLLLRNPSGEASADVQVTTLAILPFHNMTGNPELEWMENGIPEMLVTDISQSSALRPLLPDRVYRILRELGKTGQTNFDEETIEVFSNTSGADQTLHGRFMESGGRIRVDLILRERSTGIGLPLKLDGRSTEVFSLVDAITEKVTAELNLDSPFARNRPVAEVATSSLGAFRAYQRGIGDLQDGRNQSAVIALKEAVTLDPNFAMAHARLAEAHWNLAEESSAKSSIEKAQALAAEHPLPGSERFQIHAIAARVKDDPDTAIDAYRKLADFYPSDPGVLLGLASALESKGEMNQALDTYKAVSDANPTSGAALLGYGRMLVTVDRSLEAIPFLERAVATDEFKNDPETLGMLHSILGVAYRLTNEPAKALENFEISLSSRRSGGDRRGVIATLVNMASTRRKLQQYEQAGALLAEAVAEATDSRISSMESFALLNLGNLALETGQLESALNHYRASLDIELDLKQNNEIAYRLDWIAEVHRRSGRYVEALVYLEQAKARLDGIDAPAERAFNLRVLGDVQKARGHYDEAVTAYLSAVPLSEQSGELVELARTRCNLADVYVAQGRFQEALNVIEQGLEYSQKKGGADLGLMSAGYANFLLEVGDYSAAQKQLDSVGELTPEREFDVRPYYDHMRGRLLALKRDSDAAKYLSRAAEEAQRHGERSLAARARIDHGRMLMAQGNPEAGRELFKMVLEEAETARHQDVGAAAAFALAEAEISMGNLASGEQLLFEAKELATSFEGRLLLIRVEKKLAELAVRKGDSNAAEQANQNASTLRRWVLERIPAQHAESFKALNEQN